MRGDKSYDLKLSNPVHFTADLPIDKTETLWQAKIYKVQSRCNFTMTPKNETNERGEESQLEAIVLGIKEIKEKLAKIAEILHDSFEAAQPYENNWTDFYDLDEGEDL